MTVHSNIREGQLLSNPARHGAVVAFDGVSKLYGTVEALRPTSLRIEAGEFFAIIGPSGSGKSTLLGITAGFVSPTAGSITVDGKDIVAFPPYHRNFGMVFQNYALFPHMTVAENIAFPLRMRGFSRADIGRKVASSLDMVRLGGFGDRRPSELSGGQQQRVALARAAVYDPLLLLMDEPLGALDKNLREEMQEEIKRFQHALGATVIYVTHDQHEAAYMADRLAIMRSGRIEQIGPPRELYEKPRTTFVASFLGEASLLPVSGVRPEGARQVLATTSGGLDVMATAAANIKDAAFLCIRPENIELGKDALGSDNVFDGVVEDAVFTTGSVRYRITLARTDHSLTARTPSRPGIEVMQAGQPVKVGWNRDAALLLSGSER
jgi:putative spermidine/putrescine transport system ATP-binding protein